MIRIGIVDDDKVIREAIADIVRRETADERETEITLYEDGMAFLDKIREGRSFDILFTDIQMEGLDGIGLGRTAREMLPDLYLVFITSYEEYAAESYRIDAYQYILKQDISIRLPFVLHTLLKNLDRQEQSYRIVGSGMDKVKLCCDDIIYLYKSKGAKYVNYVTAEGIYRERISLGEVIKELDERMFLPVERGYVVNMKKICRLSKDVLCLEKGFEVQISRSRLSYVKLAISRYWRER